MVIMFDPIPDNEDLILCFEPSPIAIMAITAATPIIIPSMVKNARSLFLFSALKAIFNKFKMPMSLLISNRLFRANWPMPLLPNADWC
ncbi:hypothetical protein D3C85_1151130 [compost metagenome]